MSASITQYVLKVHSRCDLACDHCYVYEHADQSWRAKPQAISLATADLAALRIAEHAAAHGLPEVRIILHGGEPLLLGKAGMRGVLTALDSRISPVAGTDLRIHTNGVRLDQQWCALFDEYGVKVGISLDGGRAANDRHRRFRDGRSSHPQVRRALALLRRPEHRHLYAGILCTIDLANDPIAVYEALIAEIPPNLDLLLPHATWESPPYRPAGLTQPYADWLSRIYRRWVRDGRPVPIRLLDSLISAARGGPSWSEAIGLDPADLLVIETDGSWEQADSLKTAFDGAPATGLRLHSHTVDDVTRHQGVAARQGGLAALSATCQACPVVRICGGGLYAHRYRPGSGFDNPSVYCADLKALIGLVTADRAEPAAPAPQSRATHALPAGAFDALAAGPGDAEAIQALAQMRLSLTRALVAEVVLADVNWRSAELQKAAAEGWSLLCALDAAQPSAVREIFSHPYTHAWAIRCLSRSADGDRDLDRAHIAGLAAAAALRAGATVELPLPIRDGRLHLPTMGALQAETGSARTAVICVSPAGLKAGGCGTWHTVRRVSGPAFRVALEDLDPFRNCQEWPAADRLSAADWRIWRHDLSLAGQWLATALPAYASTLIAGLRTVVPLRPGAAGDRSATARQAFGAIALGLPREPGTLEELILHEFQHVKLHALLDLYDLFDPADRRLLRVPWRDDPRPVEGILHGAYAYLALMHLHRSRGPAGRDLYLRYRTWVCEAAIALSATGALTSDGERFVAGMRTAAEARADGQ
jgi:uncharacterized protein